MNLAITAVTNAIEALKKGKMIVVMDDESRENEGDVIIAAEFATQENINFMLNKARGLICAPLLADTAKRLNLNPMINNNEDPHKTAFTVSIDHRSAHTGISAIERAKTLQELANPDATANDFNRPGHIFPLISKEGGVLKRRGHTEATTDLLLLAGLTPVGVICEILNDDGSMARKNDLIKFAKDYNLPFLTLNDIVHYRQTATDYKALSTSDDKAPFDAMIAPLSQAHLPTQFGDFSIYTFANEKGEEPHIVLVNKVNDFSQPATVRIHSECLTGDIFSSKKCDCEAQLHFGLETIAKADNGLLIYLRQEGRGIGLVEKIKAYSLQEQGQNTIEANISLGHAIDERDFTIAATILHFFHVKQAYVITNNPNKVNALRENDIEVLNRIQTPRFETKENADYLAVKARQLGHQF